jgi:hypothetical protein
LCGSATHIRLSVQAPIWWRLPRLGRSWATSQLCQRPLPTTSWCQRVTQHSR